MINFETTPVDQKYQQAASAYKDAYVSNISGFDIVVELYKGIIKNIALAKNAYKANRLDEMCNAIEKTNKIVLALQSNLDFEEGGEAAMLLNGFYTSIFTSLMRILRSSDPEAEFDNIHESIRPIYEIWVKHAQDDKTPE